ncbi:hypothetical protein DH2020_029806 [Rehmannia glutinosa]|uniref:Uncharacterized protein n=1 Tax=Rehmannia glutinosa TaxID=99300 RepID=A0ABR0VRN1_REHGL
MDFSELLGFLIILKESIKLVGKNRIMMASILILSNLLPSILLLLFLHLFFQSYMTPNPGPDSGSINPTPQYMISLLLAVEITFLIAYFVISHISGIATILVSSASYTGTNLSSKDLFSSIKRTWTKPLVWAHFRVSAYSPARQPIIFVLVILLALMFSILVVWLVFVYPNIYTISLAILLGTTVFISQLYTSVVSALSIVVSVLEEMSKPEAFKKAGILVKGQRLHGFMLNLFFTMLFLIIILVLYLGDEGSMSLTKYALLFVNIISVLKMVLLMAYTVFYFQCKKHYGEEIDVLGNLDYTKLSTTIELGNDIP